MKNYGNLFGRSSKGENGRHTKPGGANRETGNGSPAGRDLRLAICSALLAVRSSGEEKGNARGGMESARHVSDGDDLGHVWMGALVET